MLCNILHHLEAKNCALRGQWKYAYDFTKTPGLRDMT